jgi:hypothetical protein
MTILAITSILLLVYSIITTTKAIKLNNENKRHIEEQRCREFNKYLLAETKIIEISKWIESEKACRDLGETLEERNKFIMWWIDNYAECVRNAWNKSKCKTCLKPCYHEIKLVCDNYIKE